MKELAPSAAYASQLPATIDPSAPPPGFFSKAGAWIKQNPIPTALVVAGIGTGIYLLTKKKNESFSGFSGISSRRKVKRKPKRKVTRKTRKKKTFKAVRIR